TRPGMIRFHASISRISSSILRSSPSFQIRGSLAPTATRPTRAHPIPPPAAPRPADPAPDLPEVERALGVRHDCAGDLLEVEVLVELEPLAGQDEEGRLADVQDRVADALQELRHEEIRDDEGRIRMGLGEPPERLLERVAVLAVELELAAAGVLRLVGAGVGEGGDD